MLVVDKFSHSFPPQAQPTDGDAPDELLCDAQQMVVFRQCDPGRAVGDLP